MICALAITLVVGIGAGFVAGYQLCKHKADLKLKAITEVQKL